VYQIAKRFAFSAAHSLPSLPEDHKCHRLHGHNYEVELVLSAGNELDVHGMVLDYAALQPFKDWLMATLDHHNLDDFMWRFPDHNSSTAENLAYRLHDVALTVQPELAGRLVAVRVKETADTWAEYTAT